MGIEGWYYLHENGDLIYKRELGSTAADIRDSSFARGLWPIDTQNRENAWRILVEARAAGAKLERILQLASHWHCDDEDATFYAEHVGVILGVDGDQKTATRKDFINLQESPCGFGKTYLSAMSDLCKQLGYKPSKMWGNTFRDLLKVEAL
jgi:hypothetical protein